MDDRVLSQLPEDDSLMLAVAIGNKKFQEFNRQDREKIQLASELTDGLLSVGQVCPIIAPVAGALLWLHRSYQLLDGNRNDFKELQNSSNDAIKLLIIFAPHYQKMKANGPTDKTVELIEMSLVKLCLNLITVNELIKSMQERMRSSSSSLTETIKDWILSRDDHGQLKCACDAIYKAVEQFKTTFPLVSYLENNNSKEDNSLQTLMPYDEVIYSFDETIEKQIKLFHNGSRKWLLDRVIRWFEDTVGSDNDAARLKLFWLQAGPGMGKTVFSAYLANMMRNYNDDNHLLGVIFFNFRDHRASNPRNILNSLAYQMTEIYPETKATIVMALNKMKKSSEANNLEVFFSKIFLEPLQSINLQSKKMILIFDALDEAGSGAGDTDRKQLLVLFSPKIMKDLPSWLKIFITARPDNDIVEALKPYVNSTCIIEEETYRDFHLQDLRAYSTFYLLKVLQNNIEEVELESVTKLIMDKSEGKFMYLALVIDQLHDFESEYLTKLNYIAWRDNLTELPQGIDGYYDKYLDKIKLQKIENYDNFLKIIVASFEPQSEEVMKFLLSKFDLTEINTCMKSLFPLVHGKYHVYHKSIVDWLVDYSRSRHYCVSHEEAHYFIVKTVMEKYLSIQQPITITLQYATKLIDDTISIERLQPLDSYFYRYLCDHLDSCDPQRGYQYLSYSLLTNLPWLQMSVDHIKFNSMIRILSRHVDHNLWLTSCGKEQDSVQIILKVMKLISPTTIENLKDELSTQLNARLRHLTLKNDRIKRLQEATDEYLRINNGWIVRSNSLSKPGGSLESILLGHGRRIIKLIELKDGRLASASSDGKIFLWDLLIGECQLRLEDKNISKVTVLIELQDGRLASGHDDGSIIAWDIHTGLYQRLGSRTNKVTKLIQLSDGRITSTGSTDCSILILNLLTDKIQTLDGHNNNFRVTALLELRDGRITSSCTDGMIIVWNVLTGEKDHTFEHGRSVGGLIELEDGRIASGSFDGPIKVWDLTTNLNQALDCGRIATLIEMQKGRLVVASINGIIIFDLANAVSHTISYTSVCVLIKLNNEKIVVYSASGSISLLDISTGESQTIIDADTVFIEMIKLRDGRIVVGNLHGKIKILNLFSLEKQTGHSGLVNEFILLSDGRIASSSDDKSILIWNLATGESEMKLQGHNGSVSFLIELRDGRIASSSKDTSILIWNLATGESEMKLKVEEHNSSVSCLIELRDGRIASSLFHGSIHIWNLATGESEMIIDGHSNCWMDSLKLSTNPLYLISDYYNGNTIAWDINDGSRYEGPISIEDWTSSPKILPISKDETVTYLEGNDVMRAMKISEKIIIYVSDNFIHICTRK